MTSQMDPLSLLRQFLISKRTYKEEGDNILFGDVYYPKHVKTNFLKFGTDAANAVKDYYTLESLVFLLKHVHEQHPNYVKLASSNHIVPIFRADRRDLLNYLQGDSDTTKSIDKNAPLEITVQHPIPVTKLAAKRGGNQVADYASDAVLKKQKMADDHSSVPSSQTERLNKRFDNTDKTTKIAEIANTELSTVIPIEKLALLRQKAMSKKREQVSTNENEDVSSKMITGGDTEEDATKEIQGRERVWRDRRTVLESNSKRFDTNIFAILQSVKTKEDGGLVTAGGSQQPLGISNDVATMLTMQMTSSQPASQPLQSQQQNSKTRALNYSRFDQERYGPTDDTGGFSIDTKRSYQFNGLNDSSQPLTNNQKLPPSQQIPQQQQKPSIPASITNTSSSSSSSKRSMQRPIIVVPASRTSIITLYNVVDLLQDLKYVPSEEKRKNLHNATKESEIIMRRKEDGNKMQFKVVDSVSKLSREDWDRVVAVFTQGPAWQFKDWPWEGNPMEIFAKVKAFHIKWSAINVDVNIARWSVPIIELDQNKRHLDRARLLVFWDELDK